LPGSAPLLPTTAAAAAVAAALDSDTSAAVSSTGPLQAPAHPGASKSMGCSSSASFCTSSSTPPQHAQPLVVALVHTTSTTRLQCWQKSLAIPPAFDPALHNGISDTRTETPGQHSRQHIDTIQ
jgi:hypothetical protein